MLKNTEHHYGLVSIVLHWVLALMLAGLFTSGVIMTGLDYYDPLYTILPWWHKSIGLLVFSIFVFKLIWNTVNKKPLSLESQHKWEMSLALMTHVILIVLIGLICVTGYVMASAAGAGVSFFDWFEVPALVPVSEKLENWSGNWHWWLGLAGTFVVGLHIAGVLKHTIIDRDGTLARMFVWY